MTVCLANPICCLLTLVLWLDMSPWCIDFLTYHTKCSMQLQQMQPQLVLLHQLDSIFVCTHLENLTKTFKNPKSGYLDTKCVNFSKHVRDIIMHVHQTLYPFVYADESVYNSILLTWSCNAAQEVTCSSTGLSSVCNKQRKRMWSRNMGRKCGVWTVLVVTLGICDQTTFVKALCNWAVASSPGPDFLEGSWKRR